MPAVAMILQNQCNIKDYEMWHSVASNKVCPSKKNGCGLGGEAVKFSWRHVSNYLKNQLGHVVKRWGLPFFPTSFEIEVPMEVKCGAEVGTLIHSSLFFNYDSLRDDTWSRGKLKSLTVGSAKKVPAEWCNVEHKRSSKKLRKRVPKGMHYLHMMQLDEGVIKRELEICKHWKCEPRLCKTNNINPEGALSILNLHKYEIIPLYYLPFVLCNEVLPNYEVILKLWVLIVKSFSS